LKFEQNDFNCNDVRWKAFESLVQTSKKGEWTKKPRGLQNHNLGNNNFVFPTLLDPHKPNQSGIIVSFSLVELTSQVLGLGYVSFIPPFLQVFGAKCRRSI
jgi:hypothetical protein